MGSVNKFIIGSDNLSLPIKPQYVLQNATIYIQENAFEYVCKIYTYII